MQGYQRHALSVRATAANGSAPNTLPKLALNDLIESGELNTLLREALQANPGLQ
jgi:hypothetical protein